MALSLSKLEGYRDKLVAALASGESRISYSDDEGQSVHREFRSVAEIREPLADEERRIAALQGGTRIGRIRFAHSKGL